MIISVEELKSFISTDLSDAVLESKLLAIEILIRKYTNNNFQNRKYRTTGSVDGHVVMTNTQFFKLNDTIMIDDDLTVISDKTTGKLLINKDLLPEDNCLITKVEYPEDVKMGVVNMMQWDLDNRSKVGIQSETISRHSVTYFNMDGTNSLIGYPNSLVGFLKPYIKARF